MRRLTGVLIVAVSVSLLVLSSTWTEAKDCPSDAVCFAGVEATGGPGALVRGGSIGYSEGAGVFAIRGDWGPTRGHLPVGFRAAH